MRHALQLIFTLTVTATAACFPVYHDQNGVTTSGQVSVVDGTGGGIQYLYVPATNIPVSAIQNVTVTSVDGRTFTLGPAQVQSVASGRVALGIPAGVTQGTVVITANGVATQPIPFYIAQPMTTLVTTTTVVSAPVCNNISGTWTGNISDTDPSAVATAIIRLGPDCRSVSGFIHWEGPRIGSVDSTIAGVWDSSSGTLIARDTQLFNVYPTPGAGFCPTTRYQLNITPDGRTLTGLNIVTERSCRGRSRVHLHR